MPRTNELICYCFGFSMADIWEDARKHGRSTILDRITAASRAGSCRCTEKNPKGR